MLRLSHEAPLRRTRAAQVQDFPAALRARSARPAGCSRRPGQPVPRLLSWAARGSGATLSPVPTVLGR